MAARSNVKIARELKEAQSKDSEDGTVESKSAQNGNLTEDDGSAEAMVALKAQFLEQLSQEDMPKALEICQEILQHEPDNPLMLEYQKVLGQAIELALAESEDEGSVIEEEEGKEGDAAEHKEGNSSESSEETSDESGSSEDSLSGEEKGESSEEESKDDENMADLELEIGEAEEQLFKKLAELRIQQEHEEREENRLWESQGSEKVS